MRLNRFLAAAGLGSRRHCDELIAAGRVTINGKLCADFSAQPIERDHVKVDGKLVLVERLFYILLHKPAGFVSTSKDPNARDTIFDLLPAKFPRLFNVGRLDTQSEGLIVLTNDGDFAQKLTHPRHQIEKEYEVTLDRVWAPALAAKLRRGVFLDGQRAQMVRLQAVGPKRLRVILRQGINRQIRRMFYEIGYEVKRLVRIRVGHLRLGDLPRGDWRMLSNAEVSGFRDPAPRRDASIGFAAENLKRRRAPHATTGQKADQNGQPGGRNRGGQKRPDRRKVRQFKNKHRQRPAR